MQIRIQGKTVQLIRSPYDPETKRCIPKIFAKYPAELEDQAPAEILAQLSGPELETFKKWWIRVWNEQDEKRWKKLRESMADTIREFAVVTPSLTQEQADDAWMAIAELQKSLKKHGHKPPKRQVKGPRALPGQGTLLADQPAATTP